MKAVPLIACLALAACVLPERSRGREVRRGGELYSQMCAVCHGDAGEGFLADNAPALAHPDFLESADNAFLYRSIAYGRRGTVMSAFGARQGGPLTDRDIYAVIAFLRTLPAPPGAQAAQRSSPLHPSPIPLGPVPLNPAGPEPQGFLPHPKMTKADQIKAQLDSGARMALLDARPPTDYAVEHIAGAVSVPFYDPGPFLAQLPKDAWLVAYCGCPHAESGTLANKLIAAGFTKVTVLDEGLRYWKDKGWAMKAGKEP